MCLTMFTPLEGDPGPAGKHQFYKTAHIANYETLIRAGSGLGWVEYQLVFQWPVTADKTAFKTLPILHLN